MNGALQFPCTVFRTRALYQKERATVVPDFDIEAPVSKTAVHVLLKICNWLIEDQSQSLRIEGLIGDDCVDSVNKFG